MRVSLKAFFALPCLLVLMMLTQQPTVYAVDMVHEDLPLPAPVRMLSGTTPLIWTVDKLQKWTTEHWWGTGDSLILIGLLENPGVEAECAYQDDFKSVLDGEVHEADPSEMMDDAKGVLELNYVGGWSGVCLEPGDSERVYVAFEGSSQKNKLAWKTFDVRFFGQQYAIVPQLSLTPAPTVPAPKMTLTAMAVFMTQTAAPQPTATAALFFPTALPVQAELEAVYAELPGVIRLDIVSVRASRTDEEGYVVYAEAIIEKGTNRRNLAQTMLQKALEKGLSPFIDFTMNFSDGVTCDSYMLDLKTNDWRISQFTAPVVCPK